jgi:predicted O-linked N-acetylglucosamine transferase (SPINDLY family)
LDRKYSPILYIQQLQSLGYWQGLEEQARQAIAQLQQGIADQTLVPVSPFLLMTLPVETTPSQQLACARYWSQKTFQGIPQLTRKRRPRASKIRLAYISPDFRSHPGATLVPELFENHDRRAFEVIAYALGPDDQSPFRQRIVQACDRFVDLHGATATASALRIAEDAVDILVDLSGYTQHTKANVLAMRPAPVQVNYLGYPGTMGADFIDYILADDYVIPPSETCYFQEKVVYLPGAYQVNTPNWQVSPPPTREQAGLPPHGFVFCCFHASYKITLPIYRCWLRLLQAIPGSVLWLLQSPPSMVQNLQALAAKAGIDPHRIIFAPRLPLPEHFARHRLADLFLDCYPVNAHTTASDALRMGLPLVTLSGPSFISRVAGSLLRTVGLPELITHDLASYEAVALELARQPQRLQAIQDRLPQLVANSSLFDIQHATCKLEAAFQAMYANDLQGFPPRAFRISEQFQAIFPP